MAWKCQHFFTYLLCTSFFYAWPRAISGNFWRQAQFFHLSVLEGVWGWWASSPFLLLRTPLLNAECTKQISRKIGPLTFSYSPSKKVSNKKKKINAFLKCQRWQWSRNTALIIKRNVTFLQMTKQNYALCSEHWKQGESDILRVLKFNLYQ